MGVQASFDRLVELLQTPAELNAAAARFEWDAATGTPEAGRIEAAQIRARLEREAHEAFSSDSRIRYFLEEVGKYKDALPRPLQRLVGRLLLAHQRASALPPEFVEQKAKLTGEARAAWEKARAASDFSAFAPHLQAVLDLTREEARLRGGHPDDPASLYTALLEGYEPGLTTDHLIRILSEVREWLVPFCRRIQDSPVKPSDDLLNGVFPAERQAQLADTLLRTLGFDFTRGSFAVTAHPFCIDIAPNDVRVALRFPETRFGTGFFGTVHEGGHALFAQGVDTSLGWLKFTPQFVMSLGLHESQSRLWENQVGRSRPFWTFFAPILRTVFPVFNRHSTDAFHAAINVVQPSPIRILADEITYNLHILMRVELELDLISGRLAVADLPAQWNRLMQEYVGYTPRNDAEGVLQDVHWSQGSFGYFGTYTLGNLASAQIFQAFTEPHPVSWERQFESGNFSLLLDWLRRTIHPFGLVTYLDDALTEATGEPIDPQCWFRYIEQRFGRLYQL